MMTPAVTRTAAARSGDGAAVGFQRRLLNGGGRVSSVTTARSGEKLLTNSLVFYEALRTRCSDLSSKVHRLRESVVYF